MSYDFAKNLIRNNFNKNKPLLKNNTDSSAIARTRSVSNLNANVSPYSRFDLMTPMPSRILRESGVTTYTFPDGREFRLGSDGKPVPQERTLSSSDKENIRGGSFLETRKEVDHKVPIALGGTDSPSNLQALVSKRTIGQQVVDFITGKERMPGEFKPKFRQEGKMLVEWRAIEKYNNNEISLSQALAAVQHYDNKELVNDFLDEEFYKNVRTDVSPQKRNFLQRSLDPLNITPSLNYDPSKNALTDSFKSLNENIKKSRKEGILNDVSKFLGLKYYIDPNETGLINVYSEALEGEQMLLSSEQEEANIDFAKTFKTGLLLSREEERQAQQQAVQRAQGTNQKMQRFKQSQGIAGEATAMNAIETLTTPFRLFLGEPVNFLRGLNLTVSGSDYVFSPQTRLEELVIGKQEIRNWTEGEDFYALAQQTIQEKLENIGVATSTSQNFGIATTAFVGMLLENPLGNVFKKPVKELGERAIRESLEKEIGTRLVKSEVEEISNLVDKMSQLKNQSDRVDMLREFSEDFISRPREFNGVPEYPKLPQSEDVLVLEGDPKPLRAKDFGEEYRDVINLRNSNDLERLKRIIGDNEVDELIKNGTYRGRSKEFLESRIKTKIVDVDPTSTELMFKRYSGANSFYHGTSAKNYDSILRQGLRKGDDLPPDAVRGGGYGDVQKSISLTTDPEIASRFSGIDAEGAVFKVSLKPDAKIYQSDVIEDAVDLNKYADELIANDVDAVWIGGGEKELVVFNEDAIKLGDGEKFIVADGFKGFSEEMPRAVSYSADGRNKMELDENLTPAQQGRIKALAQESTVASETVATKLDSATYAANRINQGKAGKVTFEASRVLESVADWADETLAPISTRLANINPKLKERLRRFEFELAQKTMDDTERVLPLLKKTQGMDASDFADFDLAVKNGDEKKINSLAEAYGFTKEIAQARELLDEIYEQAKSVGYNFGYQKNYFPRTVKDSKGLIRYLQGTDDWSLIQDAISNKEASLQRILSSEEKADLINTLLRGYGDNNIKLSKIGAMKDRSIDILDSEINKYYNTWTDSLVGYIYKANDAIKAREFFGKKLPNYNKQVDLKKLRKQKRQRIIDIIQNDKKFLTDFFGDHVNIFEKHSKSAGMKNYDKIKKAIKNSNLYFKGTRVDANYVNGSIVKKNNRYVLASYDETQEFVNKGYEIVDNVANWAKENGFDRADDYLEYVIALDGNVKNNKLSKTERAAHQYLLENDKGYEKLQQTIERIRKEIKSEKTQIAGVGKATKTKESNVLGGEPSEFLDISDVNDSIGAYTSDLVASGDITPSQELALRNILQARFNPSGTHGFWHVYKNLSYIDTMGSSISAITQIGDMAFSIYNAGLVPTMKNFGLSVVNRNKLTMQDIGIDRIAEEFTDGSTSGKAVTKLFRLVGLEKMDAIGKNTMINSSIDNFKKLAKTPNLLTSKTLSGDLEEFRDQLVAVFGEDRAKFVIDDLVNDRVTEDVKYLAFSKLLDYQPVALSEMPEKYLSGGNARIFYMLKSYTLKQFDIYRREVFQQIAKNPKRGIKNLIRLSAALVAMNWTADEIKAIILGRPLSVSYDKKDGFSFNMTTVSDRSVDNVLRIMGFSKFAIYKAREEGIASAVSRQILPPFKFIDAIYKDVTQSKKINELETISSIPVGGKLYYWWFGAGKEKSVSGKEEQVLTSTVNELLSIENESLRKDRYLDFIKEFPELKSKLDNRYKDKETGITKKEKRIRAQGVANGERSQTVFNRLNKLSGEKRTELYLDWKNKGIITDSVYEQLKELFDQQANK